MDDQVLAWLRQLKGKAGLDAEAAERMTADLGLAPDYAAFLREHDGAEGFIGESYARFYGAADFADEAAAPALEGLEDLVIFGSNGGGEAFAFDAEHRVVMVPWIGAREDAIPQGTFEQFVRRLHDDRIFEEGSA